MKTSSIATLLLLAAGCGSTSHASVDAGTDATAITPECASDSDCAAKVPPTSPANCATATCDALRGVCVFSAKDEDGDGHAAADCTSTTKVAVQAGDDCNDRDATLYPGHPKPCHTAPDGGPAPAGFCTGLISCEKGGKESACEATLTCIDQSCVDGVCTGTCAAGNTQCSDSNGVQTCGTYGAWGEPVACGTSGTCAVGAHGASCTGSCLAGATMCSGNGLQTCDANGEWSTPVDCGRDHTCFGGACVGECGPGQTECLYNGVATCTATGQWPNSPATTCTDSGSTCVVDGHGAASCEGSCAPGQQQTCNYPPACNTTTVTCGVGAAPGTFPACPPPQNPVFADATNPTSGIGAACAEGVGACRAEGTVLCVGPDSSGNFAALCSAVPGQPVDTFQAAPAPNGSWDWNCDGQIEAETNTLPCTTSVGGACGVAAYCDTQAANCTANNPTSDNGPYISVDVCCNGSATPCGGTLQLADCTTANGGCTPCIGNGGGVFGYNCAKYPCGTENQLRCPIPTTIMQQCQ